MPFAKVNNINMYYEINGTGEPLILVAGLAGDSSLWARITPFLTKDYKVIVFDNRGSGQSDKPDISYTVKMMSDDLAGLLDALGIKETHIFGVSMGGMIAQQFALDYPQRLLSLILGCTASGGPNTVGLEDAANMVNPKNRDTLSAEENIKLMIHQTLTKKFIDGNPEIIEEIVAYRTKNPADPVGRARQFQAVMFHDTYDKLPNITTRTLVIAGDEDMVIHPENSRILASRIPNSTLVILKDLGHDFRTESPDETSKIILDFLKRNE
ncbi:alpha/beta fold hydrolase [Chloroflexota bacterium]